MSPTIAIYFSDPEPLGYPFTKKEYLESYTAVIQQIEKEGIDVRIVRGDSYKGAGRFSHGWKLLSNGTVEKTGDVKADLIFNRDDKNTIPRIEDCPIINHPDLDELCVDKLKTAETFPDISPKTAAVESFEECKNLLQQWELSPTDKIVLKKNFETEGRKIHILPIGDVQETLYASWADVLAQEFIDSSVGIAGITDGVHDLRINIVDGRAINAYLRTPKEGSLIANIARGGSGSTIPMEQVPEDLLKMMNGIIQKISKYQPLLLAVDFMNSKKGFRLVELNSRPGLQHHSWTDTYDGYNFAVAQMLVKAVKKI